MHRTMSNFVKLFAMPLNIKDSLLQNHYPQYHHIWAKEFGFLKALSYLLRQYVPVPFTASVHSTELDIYRF